MANAWQAGAADQVKQSMDFLIIVEAFIYLVVATLQSW